MKYDIIGDIHGRADKLEGLLLKLGYKFKDNVYQQESHQAIFVGDFIDRGKQNRRVLEIVKNMIDLGHARAVMGNHEYNAICYHTLKPISKIDYLRPHKKTNFEQHENFLKEYPLGHDDTNEVIAWFKTLPLFFELEEFRVIHACWDKNKIKQLKPFLNYNDNTLKEEHFADSANEDSELFDRELFNSIERLLKGPEVELPGDHKIPDKDGKERHEIRVKWWGDIGDNYRDIAFGYNDDILKTIPNIPVQKVADVLYSLDDKPVFFGHYWMTGKPILQQENICCVDYSAGEGEKLVCYTFNNLHDWQNEKLDEKNFIFFNE